MTWNVDICVLFSLFSSLQDSMDEACADGIGDEHYRLEGRPPALHHPQRLQQTKLSPFV